jgi:hypothetical protein
VFCGGLDLAEGDAMDRPAVADWVDLFETVFLQLCSFRAPVIAALTGPAIAGGAVLALACDERVAPLQGRFEIDTVDEEGWPQKITLAGSSVSAKASAKERRTEAHHSGDCAELVCSNSFRSDDSDSNAVGLIHHEMRELGSLIMACGDRHQVPAGSALAVDRDGFSDAVTAALEAHPLVTIARGEMAGLPPEEWDNVIIATGPLTSPALAEGIRGLTGETSLAFFDAIAPIVHRESVDMGKAWFQSRYDKAGPGGTGADYLNCPMDKEQYHAFVEALLAAEKTEFKEWEKLMKGLGAVADFSTLQLPWMIGDALIFGQAKFPEIYAQAIEFTGLSQGTLYNYVYMFCV